MSENRRNTRIPYDRAVRVRCDSWRDFQQLYATNLSRGGVFIATPTPAPVFTPVHVQLVLPDSRTLLVHGRVVRVVPPRLAESNGEVAGMGIELAELDAETQAAIQRLVHETRSVQDAPSSPRASPDELTKLRSYLEDLRMRDPRGVLDCTRSDHDAQVLAQYEALSFQFSPERFVHKPAEMRMVAAEIAIVLRRAFEALTSSVSGAHPRVTGSLPRMTGSQPRITDTLPPAPKVAPPPPRSATAPGAIPPPVPPARVSREPGRTTGRLPDNLFSGFEIPEETQPGFTRIDTGTLMRSPNDWHRMGMALVRARRYREAREFLRRAFEADRNNRQFERDSILAQALETRAAGRFEDAAGLFVQVLTIDSESQEAITELRALLDERKIKRTPTISRVLDEL